MGIFVPCVLRPPETDLISGTGTIVSLEFHHDGIDWGILESKSRCLTVKRSISLHKTTSSPKQERESSVLHCDCPD
ncbi:hypothetical protein HAX54_043936 [Datura stramonium]|uniref:Uncharacterized protein n=1 Tax=Datura stramonium TaxID=4076 RepID=A0ABS8W582_DATST|nr:hypothetical protein [Datura stramonium]